jgi:hypothetical protein
MTDDELKQFMRQLKTTYQNVTAAQVLALLDKVPDIPPDAVDQLPADKS